VFGLTLAVLSAISFLVLSWLGGLVSNASQIATQSWGFTAPPTLLGVFLLLGGPREVSRLACAVFATLTGLAIAASRPWSGNWTSGEIGFLATLSLVALGPMAFGMWATKRDLSDWRDHPKAPRHDH